MRWAGHVARLCKRKLHTGFSSDNLKKRDHLEDLVLCGKIILEWVLNKYDEMVYVDWNYVAQDRDRYRAFVNTLMNFRDL
jgi:hypothetical protein